MLDINIFNDEYGVKVLWDDREKALKKINKHFKKYGKGEVDSEELKTCRGKTFLTDDLRPIIWFDIKNKYYQSTIAHEAIHAVKWIFEYIGEKSDCEELLAHSVAAIVRQVMEKIK